MDRSHLRSVANWLNLSTPLGLAVARVGGCTLRRGPDRLWFAEGYRLRYPDGGTFTIGDVVLTARPAGSLPSCGDDEIAHEEAHARQWTYCLGLPFLPAYLATVGWSWLRTGDRASACFFEQEAGLSQGNYVCAPTRSVREGFADLGQRVRGVLR